MFPESHLFPDTDWAHSNLRIFVAPGSPVRTAATLDECRHRNRHLHRDWAGVDSARLSDVSVTMPVTESFWISVAIETGTLALAGLIDRIRL